MYQQISIHFNIFDIEQVNYFILQIKCLFLFVETAEHDVKQRKPTVKVKNWMELPLTRIELQSEKMKQLFKI